MAVTPESLLPAAGDLVHEAGAEPRETGGVTTRLVLSYVEREGGRPALDELLRITGLEAEEARLRDENQWFSYQKKIRLLDAAAEVLDDPLAARHIGEAGLDFDVGGGLKLSLRALGSLRLLYKNIVRTCSKFTLTHKMEAVEIGKHHARINYVDVSGTGYDFADCQLNLGLLSCAPGIFGLPLARVNHPICARDGGDTCVYELRWQTGASRVRTALTAALLATAEVSSALVLAPKALPEALGLAVAGGVWAASRELRFRRNRLKLLERRAVQQAHATERLTWSLQDLVSDLRLDEVLSKITRNGKATAGGKEFVLLVGDGEAARCQSSTTIPDEHIAALEQWAANRWYYSLQPHVIDDLTQVPELAALPGDRAVPLRSLCAAPLVYRDQSLGLLVALANGQNSFLPHEVDLLRSYAAQAAIALTNARLYEAQEALATRDPLTELHNHREFHETVAGELERCRRHGARTSVVLFDLDGFKQVNDSRGHASGDRVLTSVARALERTCRSSDRAFRIGGDEFALVLPGQPGTEAMSVATRASEAMAGVDEALAVSFGVAEWPDDGPTKDTLLESADRKLYAMKRAAATDRATAYGFGETADPDSDERRRGRLAAASRLSTKLAALHDAAEIAATTVHELQATFGYYVAVIHRLDPDGMLRSVGGAGALLDEVTDFETWEQFVGTGVNGRVARTGEPAIINDTRRDPDFIDTDAPHTSGSELSFPIRVAGEIWGVLNLEHLAAGAFGADDLLFADLVCAHVGAALDRGRLVTELEGTFMTTLGVLCDALEQKDAYTAAHAREVEELTERVGVRLGLAAAELRTLRYGALLHDIGKIGVRGEVLNKPGKLTDEEFEEIKEHTVIGARMLERIPFFEDVHPIVRSAHEHWDGRGYPDGLVGEKIPLGARIVCACDAFHAMTSDRPYRAAMPEAEAIQELVDNSGTQFDPGVVDALVREVLDPGSPE
ncbi:MAG: HD domain-containing phosphohydrolase [Thermoleophilaceae bacterium]